MVLLLKLVRYIPENLLPNFAEFNLVNLHVAKM